MIAAVLFSKESAIPRFTIREILFATIAIAALVALSITTPKRKEYEDTGTNQLTPMLLQRVLDASKLRARILNASSPGDRWGSLSIVSPSRDDATEILAILQRGVADHLKANGFSPDAILNITETRRCIALQWQSEFHVAGFTMIHTESISTSLGNEGVSEADFEHQFVILTFEQ